MAANRRVNDNKMRFTLEAFEAVVVEALGEKPGVTLELKDGSEIHIPHPATVDDDRLTEIERVQNLRDLDEETDEDGTKHRVEKIGGIDAEPFAIRFARAILGPADHARLIAGGGKSAHVIQGWQWLTRKEEEEDGDEGRELDPKPEK